LGADTAAAYVAGALTGGEARTIDGHIDKCSDCRQRVAEAARSGDEAAGSGDPRPGDMSILADGTRIGRYVIEGPLGVGAMGVVVRARDPELGRAVALKRVRGDLLPGQTSQSRLLREAQAMARLSHPNVVAVYDVVIHERQLFIAMELVDGISLRAWLAQEKRSRRDVIDAFVQAGRGLAAAHAAGLVHRDFKPDNVLRDADGRVRVTDFGLAHAVAGGDPALGEPHTGKALSGSTKTGSVVGTPAYMAPEQHRGEPANMLSDQFSFCVALYEALYGEHPFATLGPGRLTEVLDGDVVRPPPASAVPSWIRRILLRGLKISYRERYPSMEALIADLMRDRRARWRRMLVATWTTALVAGIAIAYRHGGAVPNTMCRGGDVRLQGVWDDTRRREVRDSFSSTGRPYATTALLGAEGALDVYARAWSSAYTDACEATSVRGEQSAEAMDLRMACLSDRLKEMGALVEVLAHADDGVVGHALAASESLTSPAVCSDAAALRARIKPPADRATAAKIEAIQGDLLRAKALAVAGRFRQALPVAANASTEADAIGYLPLQAEASYRLGGLQAMSGDLVHAESSLLRAIRTADASGDDRTRVEASRLLLYNASRRAKPELISVLQEQAMGALQRLGGDEEAEARLFTSVAGALTEVNEYEQARSAGERALQLSEKSFGGDSSQVAEALTNLGIADAKLGYESESLRCFNRSLSIELARLGPDHPTVAAIEDDIGEVMLMQLQVTEAAEHYRRAVEIAEANLGPDHFRLALYLHGLAETLILQGRYDSAEGLERRALAISEKALGREHPRLVELLRAMGQIMMGSARPKDAAEFFERALKLATQDEPTSIARVKFGLAQALLVAGSDARARELALEARDSMEQAAHCPRDIAIREQIRTWLDTHFTKT
jgi:tetratricopeptide (TPR) repeat protein